MRGTFAYQQAPQLLQNNEPEVIQNYKEDEMQSPAQPITALGFILGLLGLYLIWDVVVQKNKSVGEVVDASNIRSNLYNLIFITLAAVIGVNLLKVFFVKVAAWDIPGLSWVAKQFIPLFQL